MDEKEKASLETALNSLATRIRREIESRIAEGHPVLRKQTVPFWRFPEFRHTSKYLYSRYFVEYVEKLVLPSRVGEDLFELAKKTQEYTELLPLVEKSKVCQPAHRLNEFTIELIQKTATGNHADVTVLLADFTTFLSNQPVDARAIVLLDGLLVGNTPIQFALAETKFLLRRTTRDDVEREFDFFSFDFAGQLPPPETILEITTIGPEELVHNTVFRSIAVLLLFGRGSVQFRSCRNNGRSFMGFKTDRLNGKFFQSPRLTPYSLSDSGGRLKAFWPKINECLPPDCYARSTEKVDHLAIAFQRYSDAVSSMSRPERTIADAIMALESLFLPDDNEGELNYRLTTYAAKILGILGLDPIQVRKRLKKAYGIRSKFVHGGQLSPAKRGNVYANESIEQFTTTLLDYVRMCLIVFILLSKKKTKKDLTTLIEDSLISEKKQGELHNLLVEPKEIIKLCLFPAELFEVA